MEITKGENANLAGMEPRCPKIEVVEVCPANAPDKHSVRVNGREIVAFDYGHEAHSVAGNLRMALAQFFRSPAPTPPLDVEAEKRITEIRERESKTTKGPWKALPIENSPSCCDGIIVGIEHTHPKEQSCWDVDECPGQDKDYVVETDSGVYGPCWEDADFIAHSRQDIPFLLEQISLLRRHIASPAQPEKRDESKREENKMNAAELQAEVVELYRSFPKAPLSSKMVVGHRREEGFHVEFICLDREEVIHLAAMLHFYNESLKQSPAPPQSGKEGQ